MLRRGKALYMDMFAGFAEKLVIFLYLVFLDVFTALFHFFPAKSCKKTLFSGSVYFWNSLLLCATDQSRQACLSSP